MAFSLGNGVPDRFGARLGWRGLMVGIGLMSGCSSSTPEVPDGSAPADAATHADVSAGDAEEAGDGTSAADATLSDAILTPDGDLEIDGGGDVDGGCGCSHIDSGIPQIPLNGVIPMSCYCQMPWAGLGPSPPCMGYDDAVACKGPSGPHGAVITYVNCDFVTVNYGSNGIDERHYDARTHEFVGARRGTDYSVPCGGKQVLTIQAGMLPGLECQIAKVEDPCNPSMGDAGAGTGADGSDGD